MFSARFQKAGRADITIPFQPRLVWGPLPSDTDLAAIVARRTTQKSGTLITRLAWQAYREPTPQAWFNLSKNDLSILPLFGRCVMELLEELPGRATGLGATEMRLLELIGAGYSLTNGLFYLSSLRQRRVFNSTEIASLLEGLAHGPTPAVAGLDDELRTISCRDRDAAYRRSELSLTGFGKAIVVHQEDISRHNPIHRWWGGTELTNGNMWRWDPVLISP